MPSFCCACRRFPAQVRCAACLQPACLRGRNRAIAMQFYFVAIACFGERNRASEDFQWKSARARRPQAAGARRPAFLRFERSAFMRCSRATTSEPGKTEIARSTRIYEKSCQEFLWNPTEAGSVAQLVLVAMYLLMETQLEKFLGCQLQKHPHFFFEEAIP